MNDKEALEEKRIKIQKKTRFYLYSGYLLLGGGVIWLMYSKLGFILIAGGIFMRVLYYIAKMDLKALNRLENNLKIVFLLLVPCCLLSTPLSALQPGQRSSEIASLNWIKGEAVTIFPQDRKRDKIVVIECWASWDKGCQLAIPVLSSIQKKYEDQVIIVGITKEKEDSLNKNFNKLEKNISYRIAHDSTGSTVDYFTGEDARIPLILVVDKSGKILWRGHPLELEPVLKTILNGTFDLAKQKKISKLQRELQSFLQLEDIRQVINTSEKLLAIDPANDIAMRVRLFVFESQKQLPQALKFINQQISKNPDTAELYFIKLDLMQRTNASVDEMRLAMEEIANKFKDNGDALNQLAWVAVNRIQFGASPLDVILKASKKSVDLMRHAQEHDPVKLANFLSTLAKVYYMAGIVDKAVETQAKSCDLLQEDIGENDAKQLLKYYQEAQQLKNQEIDKSNVKKSEQVKQNHSNTKNIFGVNTEEIIPVN